MPLAFRGNYNLRKKPSVKKNNEWKGIKKERKKKKLVYAAIITFGVSFLYPYIFSYPWKYALSPYSRQKVSSPSYSITVK